MRRKSTGELNRELTAAPDLKRFLADNQEQFQETGFQQLLLELFQDSGISKATLEQAQELLRIGGLAQLYPKNRRDAVIIYGLTHRLGLYAVNDLLFAENEATLC